MKFSQQLVAGLACIIAACSAGSDPRHEPEHVARPERAFVEQLVPQFHDLAVQRVQSAAVAHSLQTRLAEEAQRRWGARLNGGIKYADLLLEEYQETAWTLAFATPMGLTARGAGIVAQLADAEADALDDARYHLDTIERLASELAARDARPPPDFSLDAADAEQAVSWATKHGLDVQDRHSTRKVVDAVVGLGDGQAVSPRLASVQADYRTDASKRAMAVIELEVRVADAALRYARDMRHFNYKRMSWSSLAKAGGGKSVVYERLRRTLDHLAQADSDIEAATTLTDLRPPFEQYDRLLEALERYRTMKPWKLIEPFDLNTAGEEAKQALADRLKAEEYDAPDLGTRVEAYQRAHQFAPGRITAGFWRSLNVPLETRVRQIELTLQRYRETFFREEADYVFVNIPDFHAEVYRDGELARRFRVVVGNTERVCDPATQKWVYPNATPVQWANLDHIMLNPWWNVPPRLFTEEIAPHLEDPEWLEEKGYEVWEENGVKRARQRPGEGNALGLVKFIFPNEHNTYMHDTPAKRYFDLPVRAFSHGCVRVHEPLKLAEHFMTTYEMGGKERLDRIIELGSTIKLEFEQEIPVFFEYYTVRVEEDRVQFLADPYLLDKALLADDPNEVLSCSPASPPASSEPNQGPDEVSPAGIEEDLGP